MFETMLEVGECFVERFDKPVKLSFLSGRVLYQYPRQSNVHSHCSACVLVGKGVGIPRTPRRRASVHREPDEARFRPPW